MITTATGRSTMNGKPVFTVPAKTVINFESGFVKKLLCDGPTFTTGTSCAYTCSFCVSGDALIQMADGTIKPLRAVNIGDRILTVKVSERGRWRKRFVEATVTAKLRTNKEAILIRTASAEVICSADHEWLTTRGWKLTKPDKGPRLTTNSRICSIGQPAIFEISAQYRAGYLAGLIRGDGVLNRYEYPNRRGAGANEVQHQFRLFMADPEPIVRARQWLSEAGINTNTFTFKGGGEYSDRRYAGIRVNTVAAHDAIKALIEPRETDDWLRGWLGGFFDAEGSACGGSCIRMTNTDLTKIELTERALSRFEFSTIREYRDGITNVRVRGGSSVKLRFYQTAMPALARKLGVVGKAARDSERVLEIRNLNRSLEMFDITTTAETFFANGLLAHNCYVPAAMNKQTPWLKKHGVDGKHEDVVIRRQDPIEIARRQLKAAKNKDRRDFVIYGSPLVDVAANMDLVEETVEVCKVILEETAWTIRLLSKSNLLPKIAKMLEEWWPSAPETVFKEPKGRVIYGVSTGTLDDKLAKAFEQGTPLVSKRIQSLHWLQDNGYRTFGMICPSLPCATLEGYTMFAAEMAKAVRYDKCEDVWAEVINLRGESFTRTIKALNDAGFTHEAALLRHVSTDHEAWERYAQCTHAAHLLFCPSTKLKFLQYVNAKNRAHWESAPGAVLL